MFSIKEAIVFGWHKLRERSGLVFGVTLTMFVLNILFSILEDAAKDAPLGFVVSIITFVVSIVLSAGVALVFLRLAKGETVEYRDIIPPLWTAWRYFWVSMSVSILILIPLLAGSLISLVVLIATGSVNFSEGAAPISFGNIAAIVAVVVVMLAAIVATIYLSVRYSLATISAVDGEAIFESVHTSARITKGSLGHLLIFMAAIVGLNILGLLALVVGLLVSVPVSMLAFSHVYLKLQAQHGNV